MYIARLERQPLWFHFLSNILYALGILVVAGLVIWSVVGFCVLPLWAAILNALISCATVLTIIERAS